MVLEKTFLCLVIVVLEVMVHIVPKVRLKVSLNIGIQKKIVEDQ